MIIGWLGACQLDPQHLTFVSDPLIQFGGGPAGWFIPAEQCQCAVGSDHQSEAGVERESGSLVEIEAGNVELSEVNHFS